MIDKEYEQNDKNVEIIINGLNNVIKENPEEAENWTADEALKKALEWNVKHGKHL